MPLAPRGARRPWGVMGLCVPLQTFQCVWVGRTASAGATPSGCPPSHVLAPPHTASLLDVWGLCWCHQHLEVLADFGYILSFLPSPVVGGGEGGAVEGRGKIRLNNSGGVQHPSALFSFSLGSHLGPCNHWHPSSRSPALWFGFSGPGFVRFTQGSQGHARGVSLLGYLLLCNHVCYDP